MKVIKIAFIFIASVMLLMSLTSCENAGTSSEINSTASEAASIMESSKPESSSSELNSSEASSEASELSSEAPLSSMAGDSDLIEIGEDLNFVPEPETSDDAFKEAFKSNPIDEAYSDAISMAASSSMILESYDNATSQWKRMVEIAYASALEVAPDAEALTAAQDEWNASLSMNIEDIRAEINENDPDSQYYVLQKIMLYYRERAAALCEVYYQANGSLPSFEEAMSTEAKG